MFRSAEEIYTGLVADATLNALLGTYRFDNGVTTPAIVVLDSNQVIEGLELITGLEIIVSRIPESATTPDLTGGFTRSSIWRLTLIQYPDGTPGAAQAAADWIIEAIPGSSYTLLGGEMLVGDTQIAVSIPAYASFSDVPLPLPGPGPGAAPTNITLRERDGDSLEIASSTGTGATVGRATGLLAGLLASDDALKLEAIVGGSSFEVEGATAIGEGAQASGANSSAFGAFARSFVEGVTVLDGDVGAVVLSPCLQMTGDRIAGHEDVGATITSLASAPSTFTLVEFGPVSGPAYTGPLSFPRGAAIRLVQGSVHPVTVIAGLNTLVEGPVLATAFEGDCLDLRFDGDVWRVFYQSNIGAASVASQFSELPVDGGNF